MNPGREVIDVGSARALMTRVSDELTGGIGDDGNVALLVNNLGGLSVLELGIVTGEVLATAIGARADLLIGPAALMTSLDMRGVSVTALSLDDGLRAAVLAPVGEGTAWVAARELPTDRTPALLPYADEVDDGAVAASDDADHARGVGRSVRCARRRDGPAGRGRREGR